MTIILETPRLILRELTADDDNRQYMEPEKEKHDDI